MATPTPAPASPEPAAPSTSPRPNWLDAPLRLATSWVGLFSAYAIAVALALTKYKELTKGLQDVGIRPALGVALIAALPLLALVFSTIPKYFEDRRIKRYSEITGAIQTGYFTLCPRYDENYSERADNAHQQTLRWVQNTIQPVLYLTGASGTGKSSLLSAWVIPKLKADGHVIIQLRGYEDDLLTRIKEELLKPGVIWANAPTKTDDLHSLLDRAAQRLGEKKLFIVIDQFEEFLILKDDQQQTAFRQFLSEKSTSITLLLIYRPEYEHLLESQSWPRLLLDTNRKVIGAFTQNAAQEFMRKSDLKVSPDLMRTVLREAAEIEQTTGLIRPITINLCGLVLSRFSSGLPRKFRGGLIRGFLRESLQLPEARDVAGKLIPQLITDNVTKQPRTVSEMAQASSVAPAPIRACLRRLGESDRAIVRPLDKDQETWEISHDFLVPLLDSIAARRTTSLWRTFRPWLPWTAAAAMGIAAVTIPFIPRENPRATLTSQRWTVWEDDGVLQVSKKGAIPVQSVSVLRSLPAPFSLTLSGLDVVEISALQGLNNLTQLNLSGTQVSDISVLREMKNLTQLDLAFTQVRETSALRQLTNLTTLSLRGTTVAKVSDLSDLTHLRQLFLDHTNVTDLSALGKLKRLTTLTLSNNTNVSDISALRELESLTVLDLADTKVKGVSQLQLMKELKRLDLSYTAVRDISAIWQLKSLTYLDLSNTEVTDLSALHELNNLARLFLFGTTVNEAQVSALQRALPNLEINGPGQRF